MKQGQEELKKSVKDYSEKLAKLGIELGKIKFSYKVKEKPSKKYWQKRIKDFEKYNETSMKYYNQAYSLLNLVNKEESQIFLLRISKFHQLGEAMIKIMEQIKDNPSISDSKDKQQSQWSKEIKKQITEHSNTCLRHEKDMNTSFRESYEKYVKKILE